MVSSATSSSSSSSSQQKESREEEHKTNPQLEASTNNRSTNKELIEDSVSYQHASRLVNKNIAALNALDQATKQSLLDLKTMLRHQGSITIRLQAVQLIESLTGDDAMCSILIATGIIYPLVDLLDEIEKNKKKESESVSKDVVKSALTALVNLVGSLAPEAPSASSDSAPSGQSQEKRQRKYSQR